MRKPDWRTSPNEGNPLLVGGYGGRTVAVSDLGERLAEKAGELARDESDLRKAAGELTEVAGGDGDALREAQRHWAEILHAEPENGDALGALVLVGAALYLQRDAGN